MAKTATETNIVPIQPGPPAALLNRASGRGVSQDQADNIVPLVYILQPLSPQAMRDNSQFIQGAEAGMIWLRSSQAPLVPGQEGILFQPCYFYKDWVEWVPRKRGGGGGAGYVGRHAEKPADAVEKTDAENPNRILWVRANGNELVETRYHAGWVLGRGTPEPYLIPLSGTGHTFSREWMTRMNNKRAGGKILDSWMCVYRLRTQYRKNNQGTWFMWSFAEATREDGYPDGYIQTDDDFERGERLFLNFSSGEKKAEEPVYHDSVDNENTAI